MKYMIIVFYAFLALFSLTIPSNNKKRYYVFLAMMFGILAFLIYPSPTTDLYRMYAEMDYLKSFKFLALFSDDFFLRTPTYGLYIFFISKLGIPRLFQASTLFIQYLLMFLLIRDVSKRKKLSRGAELTLLFSFLCINSFVYDVANVRFYFSTTIFIYVLYQDLTKRKKFYKCLFWYLFCSLYHNAVVLLLIFRILLKVFEKNNVFFKSVIIILLLFWVRIKDLIIQLLLLFQNIPIFRITAYKLVSYDAEQANLTANVPLYTFVSLTLLIIITTFLFFYLRNLKNYKKKNNEEGDIEFKRYLHYIIILLVFIIGSFNEFHIFLRFTELYFKMMLIIIGCVFSINSFVAPKDKLLLFLILITESILYLIFYIIGQFNLIYIGW